MEMSMRSIWLIGGELLATGARRPETAPGRPWWGSSAGRPWGIAPPSGRSSADLLHVGEEPARGPGEEAVGDQAQQTDGDDGGDDPIHPQEPLADEDDVADPRGGGHQLGDDEVGPGPAHGD